MLFILSYIIYTFLALPGSYGLGRCVVLLFLWPRCKLPPLKRLVTYFNDALKVYNARPKGEGDAGGFPLLSAESVANEFGLKEKAVSEWLCRVEQLSTVPLIHYHHAEEEAEEVEKHEESPDANGDRDQSEALCAQVVWPWPRWGPMCPNCLIVSKVRPYVPKDLFHILILIQYIQSYAVVFLQMQAIWSWVSLPAKRTKKLCTHTQLSSCVRNHERLWSIGLTWSSQPLETKELGAKNAHTNAASLWKKGEKKTLKCWRQQHGHWTDLCFIHNQNMERTSKTA